MKKTIATRTTTTATTTTTTTTPIYLQDTTDNKQIRTVTINVSATIPQDSKVIKKKKTLQ